MKKIHGKMMKGITVRSLMMLLALAGSNYYHALQATPAKNAEEAKAQATIVVNNPTSTPRTELISLNMNEVKAKLGNTIPQKRTADWFADYPRWLSAHRCQRAPSRFSHLLRNHRQTLPAEGMGYRCSL